MAAVTYFISDLHVTSERPDITRALMQFLQQQAPGADAVYVLGDLFDFWIGDDYADDCITAVKQAFWKLTEQGVPLYFVHGNRDFLIGKRFAKETGATLLAEKSVVDLYGTSTLIMHGDTLCTLDVDYQKFRRKSRSWWWQAIMLSLPLSWRLKKALEYKQRSKAAKSGKSEMIMDVTPEAVQSDMLDFGVQQLIHGHTHRPAEHQVPLHEQTGLRVVLGDWHTHAYILECRPNQQLKQLKYPLA